MEPGEAPGKTFFNRFFEEKIDNYVLLKVKPKT